MGLDARSGRRSGLEWAEAAGKRRERYLRVDAAVVLGLMEEAYMADETRQKQVEKLARLLLGGKDVDLTREAYEASPAKDRYTYEEALDVVEEAHALAYAASERLSNAAADQAFDAFVKADTSELVPPDVLRRVSTFLSRIFTATDLERYNCNLRANRSGPLSYDDVAFVAAVHRDSVNTNWSTELDAGASPSERIRRAAEDFGPRPLDRRQIAAALAILTFLQFTELAHKAVKNHHDRKASRCARYRLKNTSSGTATLPGDGPARERKSLPPPKR